MNEKGSNHKLLKKSNYQLIKKCIYQNSPISQVEVAQKLSLTTATIHGMVTPMLKNGLLRETSKEVGDGDTGAGRRRVMLEFDPNTYYLCGVDIGPYNINYALTDLQGALLAYLHTDETLDEYDKTFHRVKRDLSDFLSKYGVPLEKLLGIGISMPGLIDGSAGKIYTTFKKGWTDHDFSKELQMEIGAQVVVENNVRARMIGADLLDRSVQDEPFAYFFVSYGVGCQMIMDGKVLYGQFAAAGEIGHTVVQRGGPVCPTCGNRGCLEALAGERAVIDRCRQIMRSRESTVLNELCGKPEDLTIDHVLRAEDMGDEKVRHIMEDVLEYLGIALANTINTISPRMVMIDGQILNCQRNRELLLRVVERNMFRIHSRNIKYIFQPYDPSRGARSAASLVVRDFLLNSSL